MGVTKEQIAAAKRMTAMEFLRRYRADDLVPSSAHGEYELKSHDSFKINGESSVWHWTSRGIGGRSALDYLVHVEGVPFVEAVKQLCEERPNFVPQRHEEVERERPKFCLPPAAPSTAQVENYLAGRGISREVVRLCARQGILYESEPHHNCVFVGRDTDGAPKYAALRGIYDARGKPFKIEQAGSQKQYGFCIAPVYPTTKLAVFESAIDAMAEMTLNGETKWRLSLGGIYAPEDGRPGKPPAALEEFLRRHPEVDTLELCLDNDEKGRAASAVIAAQYKGKCRIIDNPPPIVGGDYADSAKQKKIQTLERAARNRAAPCR